MMVHHFRINYIYLYIFGWKGDFYIVTVDVGVLKCVEIGSFIDIDSIWFGIIDIVNIEPFIDQPLEDVPRFHEQVTKNWV